MTPSKRQKDVRKKLFNFSTKTMNLDEVVLDEDLTETSENYQNDQKRVKTIAFKGRSCAFEFRLARKASFR